MDEQQRRLAGRSCRLRARAGACGVRGGTREGALVGGRRTRSVGKERAARVLRCTTHACPHRRGRHSARSDGVRHVRRRTAGVARALPRSSTPCAREHPTTGAGRCRRSARRTRRWSSSDWRPACMAPTPRGRPFTGDYAGILLYETLHAYGFASQPEVAARDDGLTLIDCRITNAVKCLPPENKPMPAEVRTCNGYLAADLATRARGRRRFSRSDGSRTTRRCVRSARAPARSRSPTAHAIRWRRDARSSTAITAAATTRTRGGSRRRCSAPYSTTIDGASRPGARRGRRAACTWLARGTQAAAAAGVRRARAARLAAASARRLPDVRRRRRDALRRQGARPEEARLELLPEGRARDRGSR